MANELAAIGDLLERLGWEEDDPDVGIAQSAIEDLSEDARYYGSASWTDETTCPRQVRSLVLRAAKRYCSNHEGFNTSRAGDETVGWSDKAPQVASGGTPEFSKKEQDILREIAGNVNSGFYSTEVAGWGSPDRKVQNKGVSVPVDDGSKPFPLYANEGPW